MPRKCVNSNSPFHSYQIGELVFMTNLFNAGAGNSLRPNPSEGVSAGIDIPLRNCASILQEFPDFSGCFHGCEIAGAIEISYSGKIGNTAEGVRGFPAAILGSAGGRNETWGVPCHDGKTPILYNKDNTSGVAGRRGWRDYIARPEQTNGNRDDQRSHVYDLTAAQAATGYPALVADLPDTTVIIDAEDCGAAGTVNGFIDSYWHDVSPGANTPVDENGMELPGLANKINGINGRCTRMWNLNFWWQHPNPGTDDQVRAWTGGRILQINSANPNRIGRGNSVRIDGRNQRIAIKWERGGNNNFFYLGFVFDAVELQPRIDYNAYASYVQSDAFWTDIKADQYAQDIIATMANPDNPVGQLASQPGNRAKARRLRRPDRAFAVDSLQVGTEMWGTRDEDATGATCFNELLFVVDGRRLGLQRAEGGLICRKIVCTAKVAA